MENIRTKVNDIKNNIKLLTDELIEIQNKCLHEDTSLKYYEDRKHVLKICNDCGKIIGYPTNEELKENDYL
tara:strand:- start:3915 stop:4127 length:213 start_codon:yes stop_codon:yes gene_type:complete